VIDASQTARRPIGGLKTWTVWTPLSTVAALASARWQAADATAQQTGFFMLLRQLADRICQVKFGELPVEAVAMAKLAILDTVGVTLAGAGEETTAVIRRTLRKTAARGPALIFGDSERLDVLSAALINGVAAHALDFDDCNNTLGGHPSAPILPALWALAAGVSGKAFIAAYTAGVECETKLARAVHFHHYEKGWHPTSTLGTFGAAAACGHLLKL